MKMSEQEFSQRMAQIEEQWEARLKKIRELAEGDEKSKRIVETADDWQAPRAAELFRLSEWSTEEIAAWIAKSAIEHRNRLPSRPSDDLE